MSPVNFKNTPCHLVEFKKWPCRPVDFRGLDPFERLHIEIDSLDLEQCRIIIEGHELKSPRLKQH